MGGDIIGTDKGVYDVSTLHGCYSYLIRECNLPGRACEMVNKLYVMANIAELGVEHARPAEVVLPTWDVCRRRHWLNRGLSETSAYVKPADKTEPPALH